MNEQDISPFIPPDFGGKLEEYLQEAKKRNTELNRRAYFMSVVLEGWFKINPKFVSFEADRNDLVFATTIFETKVKVNDATREEAKEELRKYIGDKPFIRTCVITDCIYFEVYDRALKKPIWSFDISNLELGESAEDYHRRVFNSLYEVLYPDQRELPVEVNIIVPNLLRLIATESQKIMKRFDPKNLKFEAWKSYVSKAFGAEEDATVELYVQNALLYYITAILVARAIGYKDSVKSILDGDPFEADKIRNFIKSDNFFDFLPHDGDIVMAIDNEISRYAIGPNIQNEIFRLLYEELVSPPSRHQLGEFYTPAWLAKILVNETVKRDDVALDPACGSGTFLREIIEMKKRLGVKPRDIVSQVIGFDINPIAVHIAKANYLSALLEMGYKPQVIPVFLADSLMPRAQNLERWFSENSANIKFDEIIPGAGSATFYYNKDWNIEQMTDYISKLSNFNDPENLNRDLLDAVRKLKAENKDHIWFYIISNIYTPYYFRKKADIVIGNPPWLTYHDVKNPERQNFLDKLYERYKMKAGANNKTHQDLTGFFITRSQEFLKDGDNSRIAFVLTRSIMNGAQYNGLRRGEWNLGLHITRLWDIKLNPFHKPSCMALFERGWWEREIDGYIIGPEGKADITEEESEIKISPQKFYINQTKNFSSISYQPAGAESYSPYRKVFNEGATIVPRPYFFIEVVKEGEVASSVSTAREYGMNANKRRRKGNFLFYWKGDYVPNTLIYDTIMGEDIESFYAKRLHKTVLPIRDGAFIVDGAPPVSRFALKPKYAVGDEAKFYENYVRALEQMERDWERHRGEKFDASENKVKESRTMNVLDRLNYGNKLLSQKTDYKYMVVYNTSGTDIRACVIDKPVIVDYTAYYAYFDSQNEAYYVCAVLNSAPLLDRLKSLGILSERHITKKSFEIYFPLYNDENALHKEIADLAFKIASKAQNGETYESEKQELDGLIERLLNQ